MSFWLLILIAVCTAALTVAFNVIHVIGLVIVIVLLACLRSLAHHEGRHRL
jgi:hypothetical protein